LTVEIEIEIEINISFCVEIALSVSVGGSRSAVVGALWPKVLALLLSM
jgi:hypothetical protein